MIPQQSNRDAHRPDGVRAGLGTESAVGAGSLIPFEKVSGLLKEVLPVGESTNHETVGEHLQAIAERMEAELGEEREPHVFEGQEEQGEQPLPDGPMTVGIDGGYVRAAHKEGCFEVIAGRSVVAFRRAEEDPVPPAKCFGFVADLRSESEAPPATMGADEIAGDAGKPAVVFMSDGGEDVRRVQEYLHPNSEHVIAWFHCHSLGGLKPSSLGDGFSNVRPQIKLVGWQITDAARIPYSRSIARGVDNQDGTPPASSKTK